MDRIITPFPSSIIAEYIKASFGDTTIMCCAVTIWFYPAEASGMVGVTLPFLQILEGKLRGDSCRKVKLTLEEDKLGSDRHINSSTAAVMSGFH